MELIKRFKRKVLFYKLMDKYQKQAEHQKIHEFEQAHPKIIKKELSEEEKEELKKRLHQVRKKKGPCQ